MNTAWRETALNTCRLLGNAVSGRVTDDNNLPDENQLRGFCKVHRLETLVSSALRTVGVDEMRYHTLHEVADTAAFHQIKNDLLSAEIISVLNQKGVRVLPLKGSALQAVYPKGWIRTATDTDLFVSKEHRDIAVDVLSAMGFTQIESHDGDISFQKPPRAVVELHTTLGGFSKTQKQTLERLSKTPFTVNEHYVYTLFHLYKHFLYAGAGVRLFLDIYCLSRAVTDRACVEQWLDELGILPFDRAVHTVNGILFDGDVCSDDMAQVIDLIIKSGTFGTEEMYHAMKDTSHTVTHENRYRTWIRDHGFDRVAMALRYPVLKQHGWLYPVCVIRRIAHGFFFKRTVLKKVTQIEYAVDRKQIHRVLKIMHIL